MRQYKQYNIKTLWGKIILWTLFSLAVTPLILATPAHATDDNTVSIAVDQNAVLQPTGTLYKATTNVTVKTSKPYGFNLTMYADTADLINSKDPTRKISYVPSDRPTELGANQWGYSLDKNATKFSMVIAKDYSNVPHQSGKPTPSYAPSVIIDTAVKRKQAGCNCKDHCDTTVTFAANVDPAKLASGSYSTTVTYTATSKPAPKPPVVDPTVCKSGNPKNDCQVDIDANMIPVKYTGTTTNAQWTSLAKPEDSSNQGDWYNYNNKRWANAITVKDPSKYKGKSIVVDQADVLGYWVYIPRYAYEVMRRDATDAPVPAQNFTIHFEKATDPKRYPAESKCAGRNMDYRTTCGLDRDYIKGRPSEQGTWATHPAFTFGSKELNGIWFAKFETTGSSKQPTILPNERAMSWDSAVEFIGNKYVTATTLGIKDPQNTGGNSNFTPPAQNSHHLAELSSRMPKNTDWGAAAYLSASQFGAGYKGVQPNAAMTFSKGAPTCDSKFAGSEGRCSLDITGCGPAADGNGKEVYIDPGDYGQQSACSKSNLQRAYNGAFGQLASTTNNPTGVYDMAGGGWEYVAASYTDDTSLANSSTETEHKYMLAPAHKPYVDLYNFDTFAKCTWATCGGQATYEVINGKYNDGYGGWNSTASFALGLYDNIKSYWAGRGSSAWSVADGWAAGVFDSDTSTGRSYGNYDSLRVVLSFRPV